MITKIRNYIFTGFIILLPLFVSVFITVWLFKLITKWTTNILPITLKEHLFLHILVQILCIIVFLAILIVIGIFAKIVFIRKIFTLGEKLLIRIPLFRKIYISIKQISNGILGKEITIFNKVILVEYPRKGLYSLGFVTSEATQELQNITKKDHQLSVFVPTSPNPTGGMLIYVSKNDVIDINIKIKDALKFIVSAGMVPLK